MFWKAWINFDFGKMSGRRKEETIFVNNYVPLPPDEFYTKSKLQDILNRPSQYFANAEIKKIDIIYHDLHQKKMDQPLDHYQTITKDRFKDFDLQTTHYLTTFAGRAERDDLFFEKGFDRELFWKKYPHIFLSAMKKKFYYKKLKITTTDDAKLNFWFFNF